MIPSKGNINNMYIKYTFDVGVKMDQIQTDSSETLSVTIYFGFELERIVCGYEYGIGVNRYRIRTKYG
jgi:hypothetical protein